MAGLDGGPFAADAWVRLVSAISGVLERFDADDVSPQQTRALRALSRLFTTHGVTVHVGRGGRRVATLGEGGPSAAGTRVRLRVLRGRLVLDALVNSIDRVEFFHPWKVRP